MEEADREGRFRGEDPGSGHGLGEESQDAPGASTTGMVSLATFASCERLAGAAWAWSTRPNRSRCGDASRSKVLPFASAIDSRRLKRFKTEALAAAHLQHEKIVPVHAVGCERGIHYYAMQFIEGQSLAALIEELRRHPAKEARRASVLPSRLRADTETAAACVPHGAAETQTENADTLAAATIFRRGARTAGGISIGWAAWASRRPWLLEHAHQAGIVHRDVKPSNLLLDLREQLWITDFGLAQVTGDVGLTMTGEMLGTLRYASPEQTLARRGIVDHRSDIYSLGATLVRAADSASALRRPRP